MNNNKLHPSVIKLRNDYFSSIDQPVQEVESYYFCDNEHDANECADLVMRGEKRATASSLWWYKTNTEELPKPGDIFIVTNWEGIAQCVIEIEHVEIVPFNKITAVFAEREGEGDKSLEYWKKVHWDFYHRELKGSGRSPTLDMPIVCESFNKIF